MKPHRHSKPTRPTFFLQLRHRERFFCEGVPDVPSPLPSPPPGVAAAEEEEEVVAAGVSVVFSSSSTLMLLSTAEDDEAEEPAPAPRTGVVGPVDAAFVGVGVEGDADTDDGPPAAELLALEMPAAAAAPDEEEEEPASVPRRFELFNEEALPATVAGKRADEEEEEGAVAEPPGVLVLVVVDVGAAFPGERGAKLMDEGAPVAALMEGVVPNFLKQEEQ